MDTGGFDTSFLSSTDLENLTEFGMSFNEFNEGNTHEANPNGGVDIGPTARVEEGETSIDMPEGKFIFSDRITTAGDFLKPLPKPLYSEGGPVDPPTEDIEKNSKDFITNWFNDPITKARMSDNLGQGLRATNQMIQDGLENMNKSTVKMGQTSNENASASYMPAMNEITFYNEPRPDTMIHEHTHTLGKIDDKLSQALQRKFGAIPLRMGFTLGQKEHIQYLNRNGELYPRIMEMRQELGVNPGDVITDEQIKQLQETEGVNHLFQFYKPEQIKEMMNTIASNQNIRQDDTRLS